MTIPDLAGIFNPTGATAFGCAILARRAWSTIKTRYLDRVDPRGAPHTESAKIIILAWGVILAAILYIGVQAQATHDDTVSEARSAQQLAVRVAWDQYFGTQERCAVTHWLKMLGAPPQNIFDLHTTDPRYQDWARGVNHDYLMELEAIDKRRAALDQHSPPPTTEPTCET